MIATGRAQLRVALPVLFAAQRQQLIPPEKALDDALNVRAARHPILRGLRGQQARGTARGRQRPARAVRPPRSGSRRRSRGAGQGDRRRRLQGALEARRSPPSSGAATRLATISAERAALQKIFAAEFPDYAALSNPLPMTAKEIQALLSDDEAMVLFAVTEKESYVIRTDARPFRLEADPAWRGSVGAQGRRVPPRPRHRPRRPTRPASPACSILRSPTSSTEHCWRRSRHW